MRRLVRLVALLAFVLALPIPTGAQDPVTGYAPGDRRMTDAIAAARGTLDLFLAHAARPGGTSCEGCMVKVALRTPPAQGGPNDEEHIWIERFTQVRAERFRGLLANEPCCLGSLRHGDAVEFDREAISDWTFPSPGGRLHGGHTLRVMHADGAYGATPVEDVFEPEPIPEAWR